MKKLFILFSVALLYACSYYKSDEDIGEGGLYGEERSGGGGSEQVFAGKVTAGEWRDLDNWLFWSQLMTEQSDQQGNDYTQYSGYWGFYTNNRIAVRVVDASNKPQRDVPVQIKSGEQVLYQSRTDNRGETNLFIGLTQYQDSIDSTALALRVNGEVCSQPVSVTKWGEGVKWNTCTASVSATTDIDIAFIVDATGSMTDEIDFLKADLVNIISTVGSKHADANIRTAALFYRDEGDKYVTRVSDFTEDLNTTTAFIDNQEADGGGDYPEAVHTALEKGLQNLSWREGNSIRLAFMLLDAPPHKEDAVITSLHNSIPQYAKNGIRIIPIAASGVDKATEFFLRFTAIATDGTYVFITNDSGIGNEHIAASVGEYEVEQLNELIIRLINEYMSAE